MVKDLKKTTEKRDPDDSLARVSRLTEAISEIDEKIIDMINRCFSLRMLLMIFRTSSLENIVGNFLSCGVSQVG